MAISKKLQAEGAKVVISSRKASNVEAAMSSFAEDSRDQIHGVVCHVAKREDREKLIEETISKFGGIDILVSNAGTNPVFGPMLEVTELLQHDLFKFAMHIRYLLNIFQQVLNFVCNYLSFLCFVLNKFDSNQCCFC